MATSQVFGVAVLKRELQTLVSWLIVIIAQVNSCLKYSLASDRILHVHASTGSKINVERVAPGMQLGQWVGSKFDQSPEEEGVKISGNL